MLKTVNGIGEIPGTAILLETGPIERVHQVGHSASYYRQLGDNIQRPEEDVGGAVSPERLERVAHLTLASE